MNQRYLTQYEPSMKNYKIRIKNFDEVVGVVVLEWGLTGQETFRARRTLKLTLFGAYDTLKV